MTPQDQRQIPVVRFDPVSAERRTECEKAELGTMTRTGV